MRKTDNFTTFMCRMSSNLRVSTFWIPQRLSRPVMRLLYLLFSLSSLLFIDLSFPKTIAFVNIHVEFLLVTNHSDVEMFGYPQQYLYTISEFSLLTPIHSTDEYQLSGELCSPPLSGYYFDCIPKLLSQTQASIHLERLSVSHSRRPQSDDFYLCVFEWVFICQFYLVFVSLYGT